MEISHLLILVIILITTSKINAQEITMFPGFFSVKYYQDDTKISKQQVEGLMRQDSEANELWQKSKKHMGLAYLALGAEIGFLIVQLNKANKNENQTGPLIGVLASAGVALGFSFSASNLKKKAILKYNQNADVGSINFGPTYNGLGFVLSF